VICQSLPGDGLAAEITGLDEDMTGTKKPASQDAGYTELLMWMSIPKRGNITSFFGKTVFATIWNCRLPR